MQHSIFYLCTRNRFTNTMSFYKLRNNYGSSLFFLSFFNFKCNLNKHFCNAKHFNIVTQNTNLLLPQLPIYVKILPMSIRLTQHLQKDKIDNTVWRLLRNNQHYQLFNINLFKYYYSICYYIIVIYFVAIDPIVFFSHRAGTYNLSLPNLIIWSM